VSFFNVQDSPYVLLDPGTIRNGVFTGRDHSTPSRSAVKNEWSYTSIAIMSVVACARITLSFLCRCLHIYEILFATPLRNFSDVNAKRAVYEQSCRRNENTRVLCWMLPHPSRPAIGLSQPTVQCASCLSPGDKTVVAWR
jgi:hypothetical protein